GRDANRIGAVFARYELSVRAIFCRHTAKYRQRIGRVRKTETEHDPLDCDPPPAPEARTASRGASMPGQIRTLEDVCAQYQFSRRKLRSIIKEYGVAVLQDGAAVRFDDVAIAD